MNFTRRSAVSLSGALAAAFLGRQVTKAHATAQEVVNDMQIVSTGNVYLDRRAAGSQLVYVDSKGNHYYAAESVQVVENNGQVVATGDVYVEQEAAGNQEITLVQEEPCGDGACDNGGPELVTGTVISCYGSGQCIAGQVKPVDDTALAGRGFLIQGDDCCWRYVSICGTCR